MYSLWLPDILITLGVSVWFIFCIRKENVRSKGYYAFSGLLYLAGIVLIWALSRVLMYEIYTRYMLNFSVFNTTLNPYGNAQLIAGVLRWAAQGAWAWFLSSILKRGRRGPSEQRPVFYLSGHAFALPGDDDLFPGLK